MAHTIPSARHGGFGLILCSNSRSLAGRDQHLMRAILLFFASSLLLPISGVGRAASSSAAGERLAYKHAYYLFLSGTSVGCEDCYLPLLITAESLEQIAQDKTNAACALITTYERDSIWHNEGLVSLTPTDIEKPPRVLHLRGRRYRYQEISSAEALRLLQNPLGTIPISRPVLPPGSPGPSVEALALALRDSN